MGPGKVLPSVKRQFESPGPGLVGVGLERHNTCSLSCSGGHVNFCSSVVTTSVHRCRRHTCTYSKMNKTNHKVGLVWWCVPLNQEAEASRSLRLRAAFLTYVASSRPFYSHGSCGICPAPSLAPVTRISLGLWDGVLPPLVPGPFDI